MAIADDSQLMQLAAHRARDLFPVLQRAKSLTPLLFVFAFIPGLSALTQYNLDENGALWRLKSLDALDARNFQEWVDPGKSGSTTYLKSQPPLESWLSAAVMSVFGTASPFALMLVPYLSTGALVVMCFFLLQRLHGARVGFLTAIMLAFHGPFLEMAYTPAPNSLSILMAVIAFWAMAGHLGNSSDLVSFQLLISGVALGLCFLSGGPLAIVATAIIFGYAFSFHKVTFNGRTDQPTKRRRIWSDWLAVRSLIIVLLTAFAVAGWWFLMMWSRQGASFLNDWLTGLFWGNSAYLTSSETEIPSTFVGLILYKIISNLGVFSILALFGFALSCRETFRKTPADELRKNGSYFLSVWLCFAGFLLLGILAQSSTVYGNPTMAYQFLLIPCVAMAAFAIDEIARRRVHFRIVAAVLILSLITIGGKHLILEIEKGNINFVASACLVMISIATLIFWQVGVICRGNDTRQRFVIGGSIIIFIGLDILSGQLASHGQSLENHALTELRDRLVEESGDKPRATTLVVRGQSPLRLQLLMRSVLRDSVLKTVDSWETATLKSDFDQLALHDRLLIVDWKPRKTRNALISLPEWELEELLLPQEVDRNQIRAYFVRRASQIVDN